MYKGHVEKTLEVNGTTLDRVLGTLKSKGMLISML